MTIGAYKKIIDRLPQGVFVFDSKLRVRCTNAAFRRSFSETVKPKGTLAQTLGCQETGKCGEGKSCGYCTFYKLMAAAVAEGLAMTLKSADDALAVALADAGLLKDSVSRVKVEKDRDDGVWVYEVEFEKGRTEYEYEIRVSDGKILERDIDND